MRHERGQITIEAILIFGMFILVLVGISFPLALKAREAADDMAMLSDARYALEQIGTASDSVITPDGKRTIRVYVPGFKSEGNTTTNLPRVHIATRICTNGTDLKATVIVVRRDESGDYKRLETHEFTRGLYSSNWSLTFSGVNAIVEDRGNWYDITVRWRNITSTTSNSITGINCATNMGDVSALPAGF